MQLGSALAGGDLGAGRRHQDRAAHQRRQPDEAHRQQELGRLQQRAAVAGAVRAPRRAATLPGAAREVRAGDSAARDRRDAGLVRRLGAHAEACSRARTTHSGSTSARARSVSTRSLPQRRKTGATSCMQPERADRAGAGRSWTGTLRRPPRRSSTRCSSSTPPARAPSRWALLHDARARVALRERDFAEAREHLAKMESYYRATRHRHADRAGRAAAARDRPRREPARGRRSATAARARPST